MFFIFTSQLCGWGGVGWRVPLKSSELRLVTRTVFLTKKKGVHLVLKGKGREGKDPQGRLRTNFFSDFWL